MVIMKNCNCECNKVPHFWVISIPSSIEDTCPNAVYFVKNGNSVIMYVTDQYGNPRLVGSGTPTQVIITSPDDSIEITSSGNTFQISVSQELQDAIASLNQDNTVRAILIPESELSGTGTEAEQIAEWVNLQIPSIIKDQYEQIIFEVVPESEIPEGFRVSYNNNLYDIFPEPNNIETWKNTYGLPTMETFYLYGNTVIMQGDFSSITTIEIADANNNVDAVSGLEFFPNLVFFGANSQNLTSIDISGNPLLQTVELFDNQLSAIDIENNTDIIRLILGGNMIGDSDIIDAILQKLVDNNSTVIPGVSVLNLSASPDMAAPSAEGLENKAILIDRGWTVFTN